MRKSSQLVRRTDPRKRMAPRKPKIVGEVPVKNRLEGSAEEGQVVGTAQVEELSGKLIFHIDMTGKTADILRRGFSMGSFSIAKDTEEG